MFERHVAELLRSYLGAYVEGLDTESLNVRVWKGTSQRVAVAVAVSRDLSPAACSAGRASLTPLRPWGCLSRRRRGAPQPAPAPRSVCGAGRAAGRAGRGDRNTRPEGALEPPGAGAHRAVPGPRLPASRACPRRRRAADGGGASALHLRACSVASHSVLCPLPSSILRHRLRWWCEL